MKKYMFLPITLLFSILAHFLILLYIPDFSIAFNKKDNETIEVELVKPNIKKPQKTEKKADEKKAVEKKEKVPEEKQLISAEKVIEDTDVDVPKTLPNVNLPKFKDEPDISIQKPAFENLIPTSETKDKKRVNVSSEIASANAEISSSEDNYKAGVQQAGNNFFEIQSASNTNRTLQKPYPEKPSFSLESNTTVALSFYVDQNGNTYGITPVTRSDEDIEQLAIDYVSKLKFEAVSYNNPDKIQIKFYFNVE